MRVQTGIRTDPAQVIRSREARRGHGGPQGFPFLERAKRSAQRRFGGFAAECADARGAQRNEYWRVRTQCRLMSVIVGVAELFGSSFEVGRWRQPHARTPAPTAPASRADQAPTIAFQRNQSRLSIVQTANPTNRLDRMGESAGRSDLSPRGCGTLSSRAGRVVSASRHSPDEHPKGIDGL